MTKSLKDLFEVYRPKAKDEADFVDKHVTIKHKDRNGNGDDVFKGNTKKADRKKERHGYEPGEDEKVYEETEELDELSRATLGRYAKKAQGEAEDKGDNAHRFAGRWMAGKKRWGGTGGISAARVSATNEEVELEEGMMKLSKVHIVHHHDHPAAKEFAKNYTAGMKGDHREGGPSEADEKASNKFHERYHGVRTREGFAGGGTYVYHDRKTGGKWKVDRVPNGKTFYGTDHIISHHTSGLHEDVDQDIYFTEEEEMVIRSLAGAAEELGEELDFNTILGLTEEVLSELSSKTLRNAGGKMLRRALTTGKEQHYKSANLASAKVPATNEEVEGLDEISKATMGRYINKAKDQIDAASWRSGYRHAKPNDPNSSNVIKAKERQLSKRHGGIELAVKKLTKEDIINKAIETYIPEDVELPSLQERLVEKLDQHKLSEAHIHILLSMFDSLNEQNQTRMLDRVDTLEEVNSLLDFAISNRGD